MTLTGFALLIAAYVLLAAGTARPVKGATTSAQVSSAPARSQAARSQADNARIKANYAALPLAFEPNIGQTDPQVTYVARGRGYSLSLTSNAAYLAIPIASSASQQDREKQTAQLAEAVYLGGTSGIKRELLGRAHAARQEPTTVASVEMDVLGSNPQPQIVGENRLPGVTNYILGRDPSKWRSGVAHYGQVRYRNVYPGVDLVYQGASPSASSNASSGTLHGEDKFEFDFVVHPGARPDAVSLGFPRLKGLRTTAGGDLVLPSAAGDLHLHRPFAYQEIDGMRQPVSARFVIHGNNEGDHVSFVLGNYDRRRTVVIDPTVTYSTYLGGSSEDDGNAITADPSGNAYITGETDSAHFTGASGAPAGGRDVFVTELSSSGSLVFTTLVGGTADDIGNSIAVDTTGTPPGIYVTGQTASSDFPTSGGAVQPTFLGGTTTHGFLFKLSSNGSSLLWSTFIEGSVGESALGLALARDATTTADDDVYVAGSTLSPDLGSNTNTNGTVNPLPGESTLNAGAGDNGLDDGFIAKVKNGGTQYLFLTYLGGSDDDVAYGVAIDSTGKVYVAGLTNSANFPTTAGVFQPTCGTDTHCNASFGNSVDDAFVTAITSGNAPSFVYSTYLGGENKDDAFAIAVDSSGNAYVTGQTFSTKFPTKNPLTGFSALVGTQDIFVTSLNSTGTALNYSTYLGGTGTQAGTGIAVDNDANAYITGYTTSSSFPMAAATQSTFGGGDTSSFDTDAFVSELTLNGSSLSLPFSTYLGGSGDEDFVSGALAVDAAGNIYVTGNTNSSNFPLKNAVDATYNAGSGQDCTLATAGNPVPCPDAFVTVYAPGPDFSISGTALPAVNPGSDSTSTITISPLHGYSNTVNLSCSVSGGGTPAPTCSFSSTSVTGGSGTSTLTVATTAPGVGTPAQRLRGSRNAVWFPVGMVLAGTGLFGTAARRKNLIALMMVMALIGGMILTPSCGSSSSSGGGSCSTVPGAPSGLAASSTTSTGTTLNWNADSAPSGCSIGSYSVYENGTSIGTPTGPTFAVTGLTPSTPYSFTVAASDAAGTSAQSSAISVTTGASSCSTVPGIPAGLTASGTTSTGTTLNWTAEAAITGCNIAYTLYENGNSIGTATNPSFAVTGLSPSTNYMFTIAASDAAGASAQSSAISVTTGSAGTPAGTYTITVTGTDGTITHSVAPALTLTIN